jgi:hypothetical protein
MSAKAPDFTFTYHPLQRERFRDGSLVVEWRHRYPELFDNDDARVLKTAHQRQYHFFEWLSAILLYEATGHLSLIEGYTAKTHARNRDVLLDLVGPEMFEWLVGHQSGQPDLFVYRPQSGEWFFCEVKGGPDRVRENQRDWMAAFKAQQKAQGIASNRVHVIHLREAGP